jgi:hypothetical protein
MARSALIGTLDLFARFHSTERSTVWLARVPARVAGADPVLGGTGPIL